MNVERCFPKPRYKPFLTGPRRSALWVVLFVLGVVLVVVGVMELTGYDPFSDQREGDTKTVEQLAYKCPICGDWCDHLYVDNRGKRNPTEAVTAGTESGAATGIRWSSSSTRISRWRWMRCWKTAG